MKSFHEPKKISKRANDEDTQNGHHHLAKPLTGKVWELRPSPTGSHVKILSTSSLRFHATSNQYTGHLISDPPDHPPATHSAQHSSHEPQDDLERNVPKHLQVRHSIWPKDGCTGLRCEREGDHNYTFSSNSTFMLTPTKTNSFWCMLPYIHDARKASLAPRESSLLHCLSHLILLRLGCSPSPKILSHNPT